MRDLTDSERELYLLLKERDVDKDGRICIVLELSQDKQKSEENFVSMLDWLKKNPEAVEEDIFCHLDDIEL